MAETVALISVEEYLQTEYDDGDREYVDGVVVERNLGERDHSVLQKRFIVWFAKREESLGYYCFPEQRVQVARTRYRVPDVCVYVGSDPQDQIFRTPPFLVIEILSPRDTFANIQEKLEDYKAFGVEFVWIIDPRKKSAMIHADGVLRPVEDGVLRTANPAIEIAFTDLF